MEREIEQNEKSAQIKDMISGSIAGFCSRLMEYPFDTIKVIYQTEHIESNFLDVTLKLIKDEGILRLYRGLMAPLFGTTFENFIIFWFFGATERFLKNYYQKTQLSIPEIGICGLAAGFGAGSFLTPIEYIKCQMQARHTTGNYINTKDCFIKTIQSNPLSIFNGYMATVLREMPGNAIFFMTYRSATRLLQKWTYPQDYYEQKDPKWWMILSAGSCAGLSYWGLIYPIDLAKSRIQTCTHDMVHVVDMNLNNHGNTAVINTSSTKRVSLFTFLINHSKKYGIKSLYSGISVTIPRAILCNAITLGSYEYSRTILDRMHQFLL